MVFMIQESDHDSLSHPRPPGSPSEWRLLGSHDAGDHRHALEVARHYSVVHSSELVLCTDFLPDMDLALSASEGGWRPWPTHPAEIARRFQEVRSLVEHTRVTLGGELQWLRATASFALVRWWRVPSRTRAMAALGPFAMRIDCLSPDNVRVHLASPPLTAGSGFHGTDAVAARQEDGTANGSARIAVVSP